MSEEGHAPDDAGLREQISPILTRGEEILAIPTQNAIYAPIKEQEPDHLGAVRKESFA